MARQNLIKAFQKTDNIFRAIAFWALNAKLDADELKRQIDCFKAMGMAGVCLHARTGLETKYLSREWFALMQTCVEHARDREMIVWLYDEDRYPSGAAGGLVTRNPRHRQQRLLMEVEPADARGQRDWFAVSGPYEKPTAYRRIKGPADRRPGEFIVSFRQRDAQLNGWYNGYTYLDAMSVDAARAFIKSTYEPYRKAVGEHFGHTIEGFFTDEPCYGSTLSNWWGEFIDGYFEDERREIPWTTKLARTFKKRFGYELTDHLPELYWDFGTDDVSLSRYHYHEHLTTLLIEGFCKTISKWCDDAGTQFMGHVLCEETPSAQTNVVGSAMRFYEHFHIGGVDMLGTRCRDYTTVIQAASVNRQMGRKWLLSELHGATGWDFPLEGHKVMGDWQVALGVNRRCLHLAFYTMEGGRKRDYPGSISFQSAWWREYAKVEDYFARLTSIMSRGQAVCQTLVIHPVESTWLRCRNGWMQASDVAQLDRNMTQISEWLLRDGVAFDFGDESLLARWGAVERDRLRVNKATYRVVIVPPMLTIRATTLALLEQFQKRGGRVIWLGRAAPCVDARQNERARLAAMAGEPVQCNQKALSAAVSDIRTVIIRKRRGGEPVLSQLRKERSRHYLFICNTDQNRATGRMEVTVPIAGNVEEWHPLTGERSGIQTRVRDGQISFECELAEGGSALYAISNAPAISAVNVRWDRRKEALPMARWGYTLTEPNPLPIDHVKVRVGGGEWSPKLEVLKADRWIRQRLGWQPHSYFEVQPWARPPVEKSDRHFVETRAEFDIAESLPTESWIALERLPGLRSVELNGHAIDLAGSDGWWIDSCFKRYAIRRDWLRQGMNDVVSRFDYEPLTGLENIYYLSGQGVSVRGARAAVIDAPQTLRLGSIVSQGMPFYGGAVRYQRQIHIAPKPGERVYLALSKWAGGCATVRIDGEEAGTILWRPWEVELPITRAGTYAIEIEVALGRGNTLGPLHWNAAMPAMSGPRDWETEGKNWSDAYRVSDAGLCGPVRVVYRR